MSYLIDGYNLIGFCESVTLSSSDKEQALSRLLSSLSSDLMHIVFDGKNLNFPYGSKEKTGSHLLIFTPPDECADTYLKRCATQNRYKNWVLVSNDRDILYTYKKSRRLSMSCDSFMKKLIEKKSNDKTNKPAPTSRDTDYWLRTFGD